MVENLVRSTEPLATVDTLQREVTELRSNIFRMVNSQNLGTPLIHVQPAEGKSPEQQTVIARCFADEQSLCFISEHGPIVIVRRAEPPRANSEEASDGRGDFFSILYRQVTGNQGSIQTEENVLTAQDYLTSEMKTRYPLREMQPLSILADNHESVGTEVTSFINRAVQEREVIIQGLKNSQFNLQDIFSYTERRLSL